MESRLRWRPCQWCRRLGKNSWKRRSVNVAIVFLGILVALPVGLNWEDTRYASCAKFIWESVLGTAGNREITFERLLIVLGTCLVLTAMISILHIAFKVPFNLFANVEPTLSSDKRITADVRYVKPGVEVRTDHGEDGGSQWAGRDVLAPPSASSWTVLANNKSNNSLTTTTPFDDDYQSEGEGTPLLTNTPTPFDNESVTITQQDLVNCLTENESARVEPTSQETLAQNQAEVSHKEDIFSGTETQTDEEIEIVLTSVGTMTLSPNLVDVSVNTHQRVCKIVKNCGTSTSGPFMKKLRRAQRLLKEAKFKAKVERQEKVGRWREVMDRYKEKLTKLFENLEKKDRLLGYTALNRALSENEVKEICTAVRSSRDRLHTQCKLNSALREVIESKSETPAPVCPTSGPAPCR
ncbi:unnamed protein product [Lymnaea stagnalis]|uniref:Uncharacterized protein n=1 Tax=Lymnaea stagnalis TaxID=6523 RepID=A0AAV2I3N0_LYMST